MWKRGFPDASRLPQGRNSFDKIQEAGLLGFSTLITPIIFCSAKGCCLELSSFLIQESYILVGIIVESHESGQSPIFLISSVNSISKILSTICKLHNLSSPRFEPRLYVPNSCNALWLCSAQIETTFLQRARDRYPYLRP